jgi:hypothetical protein
MTFRRARDVELHRHPLILVQQRGHLRFVSRQAYDFRYHISLYGIAVCQVNHGIPHEREVAIPDGWQRDLGVRAHRKARKPTALSQATPPRPWGELPAPAKIWVGVDVMEEPDMGHSVADKYARSGHPSIQELVAEQGTEFRADPAELLGDFWPEEESIEDFLRAFHEWRGHDRSDRAA